MFTKFFNLSACLLGVGVLLYLSENSVSSPIVEFLPVVLVNCMCSYIQDLHVSEPDSHIKLLLTLVPSALGWKSLLCGHYYNLTLTRSCHSAKKLKSIKLNVMPY